MNQPALNSRKLIFIVVTMIFILGLSIDLYSPSFPSIATDLKTTEQLVQLTITTYFIGYFIGLIILGPLSDAFGRKKPLIYSLIFYILMSLCCAFSPNIFLLLFFRFLQGVGVSAVGVMFRSILSDVFTGKQLAKSMTYTTMSYRIGPIVAPVIGGYLDVYLGWQSNFYFLMLYGIFILALAIFFLPETHFDTGPLQPKRFFQKYFEILKILPFLGGGLCIGIIYGMLISFNVIGPFFLQDVLNYTPIAFGHTAFFLGVIAFLGSLSNRFLIQFFPVPRVVTITSYALLISCFLQVIFAWIFPINLYSFLVPVALVFFLSGFFSSNVMSQAIDLIPKGKGTASALNAMIIISTTAIITGLSSFLKSNTIKPFAFAYFALILLCFLSFQFLYKKGVPSQ